MWEPHEHRPGRKRGRGVAEVRGPQDAGGAAHERRRAAVARAVEREAEAARAAAKAVALGVAMAVAMAVAMVVATAAATAVAMAAATVAMGVASNEHNDTRHRRRRTIC